MDEAESLAERHLRHRGFADVRHEPDGNVPPDFLLDGRIAVEVRRLIQHEEAAGRPRGLSEVSIPLIKRIESLLERLGAPTRGRSWFLFVRFSRPLEDWKSLGPKVEAWLHDFRAGPQNGQAHMEFGGGFSLSLVPASKSHSKLFLLGMFSDHDSGGWILSEVERNLRICIAEKTRKIAPVRAKYPEWWLVLSDHVGLGLSDFDRAQFKSSVSITHSWDKVVLIDPTDHTRAFEL